MIDTNFGINPQALAVMHYLRTYSGIEDSWNKDRSSYDANVEVAPWYNGREAGVVFYLKDRMYRTQINIAVFEHRNSDEICAVLFESYTFNPPTLADIPKGVYESKSDVAHRVGAGKAGEMSDWVYTQLTKFWNEQEVMAVLKTPLADPEDFPIAR